MVLYKGHQIVSVLPNILYTLSLHTNLTNNSIGQRGEVFMNGHVWQSTLLTASCNIPENEWGKVRKPWPFMNQGVTNQYTPNFHHWKNLWAVSQMVTLNHQQTAAEVLHVLFCEDIGEKLSSYTTCINSWLIL